VGALYLFMVEGWGRGATGRSQTGRSKAMYVYILTFFSVVEVVEFILHQTMPFPPPLPPPPPPFA
jgi:hypothetical protein